MITRRLIGKVTEKEKNTIQQLFERKNALTELFKTLSAEDVNSEQGNLLYEKIVKDMGETTTKFQQWWQDMKEQYHWEDIPGFRWEISFESCEIFLVGNSDQAVN